MFVTIKNINKLNDNYTLLNKSELQSFNINKYVGNNFYIDFNENINSFITENKEINENICRVIKKGNEMDFHISINDMVYFDNNLYLNNNFLYSYKKEVFFKVINKCLEQLNTLYNNKEKVKQENLKTWN
jgi:hypothetical protein